jgi:hypothetical protein
MGRPGKEERQMANLAMDDYIHNLLMPPSWAPTFPILRMETWGQAGLFPALGNKKLG